MLCSRCKKRPAVVFMTHMKDGKPVNEGLCIRCASELKLPQVEQAMKAMGVTPEDIEEMSDQLMEVMDGENFEMGGADTMPNFLQQMFGINAEQGEPVEGAPPRPKREKGKGKSKDKYLSAYCTHLTEKARQGQLDPVIGRDEEIYRVTQILSRRSKNNPCLIGEPGVGKTAIAEGIAQRIAAQQVPFRLLDKEIYLLDLTSLVAGTQFRGQFESRVKGLIDEVKAKGNVILFIDEIHTIVGTGDSEGAMSAANILKPALSRGEIQVIGATTFHEYRKHIEKDSALERRFQPVKVEEPSIEDTVKVLLGVKSYYERHHKVQISDALVRRAVMLSERYITDRFLPDKAIDLVDEACACASLKSKELHKYEKLNHHLQEVSEQVHELEESNADYDQLVERRAEENCIRQELKFLEPQIQSIPVTEDDLARVIELWTGIPSAKIKESDLKKISDLPDRLRAKIVGQDEAIDLIAAAIRRSRVQLSPRRRPASFIFVGPTGVGKTELVKVLANELFDSVEPLIRLDMSEFMEKHTVSRLIGAPPGYVGFEEAGQLTEKVRRKPYSVVLFDEIEKAHPDVLNILLQILDEGRITDAQGRTVNFENTVLVMTSNAGSSDASGVVGFERSEADTSREKAMKGLRELLRPEFIGRVDEIVVFRPLSEENIRQIVRLMLDELIEPLKQRNIILKYDDAAVERLAKEGGNSKYGARDLRRTIRKEVEDKIAALLVDRFDDPPAGLAVTADETGILLRTL